MSETTMFEEDVGKAVGDPQVVMRRVNEMVALRNDHAAAVERAEQALKEEKAKLYKIECEDMPELFRSAGLKKVRCDDGTEVEIKEEINCGLSPSADAPNYKERAHKWLRENGYGGIIKISVEVLFGKDEINKADDCYITLMKEYGEANVAQQESVHFQTLKAFLKEQLALGDKAKQPLPLELFGVLPYSIAKCKAPKAKGGL